MGERWVFSRIKKKGETQCIAWRFIRDLIQTQHKSKNQVDMFTLSIYGLVIFPKSLGYIDDAVMELFDSLNKGVNPVLTILVETFRSLNVCKKTGNEAISESMKELLTKHVSKTIHRCKIWHPHQGKRISHMKTGWSSSKIFRKRKLLGKQAGFGAIGYATLLVSKQYRSRQFILATRGLATCEFAYESWDYRRSISLMIRAWNHI
ncbi:hypothetical protein GQ457_05G019280 [Hibiscus cannabinus]